MKTLNSRNARLMDMLTKGLSHPAEGPSSRTLDRGGAGIMPLHVSRIGTDEYALSHTYEQNGDLMYDPEVRFWCVKPAEGKEPGVWAPTGYRQDGLGIDREYVIRDTPTSFRIARRQQADCASFCNGTWFTNIRDQQGIDASTVLPPPAAPDSESARVEQ